MLFYRAALPLFSRTLTYVAGIVRRHRAAIGSLWRKLSPGQQALLVLAYLRKGDTFAETAAGFAVGTATAWRYVNETVALLAVRASRLHRALDDATQAGYAYVVIDGTLIPIDRVAADRPSCSGKHRKHGMNDLTAARIWGILTELAAAGLITLAVRVTKAPITRAPRTRERTNRNREKTRTGRTRNCVHPASALTPSSRPGASRASSAAARRAGQLAKAIHTLIIHEAKTG
jgi:Helix-turn-helix of DDE superfamily endonuclease